MKKILSGKLPIGLTTFLILTLTASPPARSEETQQKTVLVRAEMCEAIENYKPVNPAVVFSIALGEVYCFTSFDPVVEKTVIFHKWYKRDRLIFTMRLTLSPPKWSSFSRIQIRDADKGPWRVEIWDENGSLFETLRFSMTD
ncbi:MAG: DUF2914 domain-containing protein [Desulfobacterales bacterium]|nr:DUF2914 domain-containing protein [Desulfobacterales bacterium]